MIKRPRKVGLPGDDVKFVVAKDWVAFEDDDLLIINKPYGLPTQPTLDPNRQNLFGMLTDWKAEKTGDPYLGLHHRLDKDTSGVILFTKRREANFGVSELFKNHTIQKTYLALTYSITKKEMPLEFVHENYLKKMTLPGKKQKVVSTLSGGDHAITEFKKIQEKGRFALLECYPKTGRMHQIRTHLSELGYPIVGDDTYGTRSTQNLAPRSLLHAWKLEFIHPITEKKIAVTSKMPEDFAKCLLKNGFKKI